MDNAEVVNLDYEVRLLAPSSTHVYATILAATTRHQRITQQRRNFCWATYFKRRVSERERKGRKVNPYLNYLILDPS